MKCISYSLYGDKHLYLAGMVTNCFVNQQVYPGWVTRIHHDNSVPKPCLDYMATLPNVQLIDHTDQALTGSHRMFWRFEDMDPINGFRVMLSRDADSRPSAREAKAVEEWLESGETAHCIRESESHTTEIMGGLCGFRCAFPNLRRNYTAWIGLHKTPPAMGYDQTWLTECVFPYVVDDILYHGHFGGLPMDPVQTVHCGAVEGATEEEYRLWGIDKHVRPYCWEY